MVRKTGGLNDTVFDVDDDVARAAANGMVTNGYNFEGTDPAGIDYALNRCGHAVCFSDPVLPLYMISWISIFVLHAVLLQRQSLDQHLERNVC